MPRTKGAKNKPKSKTILIRKKIQNSKNPSQIDIEDRLIACAKGERDSIVYVGELVENVLKGKFGGVLKALTAGRIDMELQSNKNGILSSDRVLGRCEMASTLWHDLETFVHEKDALQKPLKERVQSETELAEDPEPLGESNIAE